MLTEDILGEKIKFGIGIIRHANYLLSEVMLYLCLEYLLSNEEDLMRWYDRPNEKHQTLIQFMTALFI